MLGYTGPPTHRQLVAWRAFLADDANHPSRADHYLMQVAWMLSSGKEGLDAFRLRFGPPKGREGEGEKKEPPKKHEGPVPVVTKAHLAKIARLTVMHRLGIDRK